MILNTTSKLLHLKNERSRIFATVHLFINSLNFYYFRGRELQRRLAERVKEAELDSRDRAKEKEELEELKAKVFSGEYEDPNAEFERLKKEREEQFKPKLLIDVNLEHSKLKEKERELERQAVREREREREIERERERKRDKEERERYFFVVDEKYEC